MESVKRTAEEADSLLDGVKALIVDIEGTTTPIDFVKVNKRLAMHHDASSASTGVLSSNIILVLLLKLDY